MYGHSELEIVDGAVVEKESGLPVEAWLTAHQTTNPHWWPQEQSAGDSASDVHPTAGAGGGAVVKNPWSREHWNLTEQGKVMQSDMKKAERLATAAGTTVHGMVPD